MYTCTYVYIESNDTTDYVLQANVIYDTVYYEENGTMTENENGTMTEYENGTMNEYENGTMTEYENGTMTEYENGTMTDYENGTMTDYENGTVIDDANDNFIITETIVPLVTRVQAISTGLGGSFDLTWRGNNLSKLYLYYYIS